MIACLRRIAADAAGVATLEFAMVFGLGMLPTTAAIIEFGRVLWTRQMILEVADITARCAAMTYMYGETSSPCTGGSNTVTSAATAAAAQLGFGLPSGTSVTETDKTTCNGDSNSFYNKVTITYPYSPLVPNFINYIAPIPTTLSVTACYASKST